MEEINDLVAVYEELQRNYEELGTVIVAMKDLPPL